jgi:hypothetical protein
MLAVVSLLRMNDTFQLTEETCVDQRQGIQTKSRDDETRHVSVRALLLRTTRPLEAARLRLCAEHCTKRGAAYVAESLTWRHGQAVRQKNHFRGEFYFTWTKNGNIAKCLLRGAADTLPSHSLLSKCHHSAYNLMQSGLPCARLGKHTKDERHCVQCVDVFVWISEQTAIISLYNIN